MNNIKLIIDSGTDLPEDVMKEYDISKVNLNVTFDGENFLDEDLRVFYSKMAASKNLPKTSAPAPDRYIELFEKNMSSLVIAFTSKLSGTYSSAKLAKDIFLETNTKEVEVVDTLNGCIGTGLLCIIAGEMIKAGKSLEEVKEAIMKKKDEIFQIGVLETLDNAIKGGRVSKSKAFIANALNIKPIIEIIEGDVKVTDKVRGIKGGLKKIADRIVEAKEKTNAPMLGIAHANNYERALELKGLILEKVSFSKVVITDIGAVLGTYAAEGAILAAIL